jgi:ribose/xylose/arabinose/galactoside ABC-type transport system permease subunit
MQAILKIFKSQESGLMLVVLGLGIILSIFAGSHIDRASGSNVNNFLNSYTLMQTGTDASFFAIMAIGATLVIISGGIDLSVGSVYALSGVLAAMALRSMHGTCAGVAFGTGLVICLGLGTLCGLFNGLMVVGLRVHPFIITLGTMWIFRGTAFVMSRAESILLPQPVTEITKSTLGLDGALYPVPMLTMLAITAAAWLYLNKTVMGRHVYAVGGNIDASRYAGLHTNRILVGVYVLSGLLAGSAAFIGSSYYGSASCADATGYELYVIASAVVGGASLAGGRGSAIGALLGALLIVLIRQSIRTLHFDQNYEWIIIGAATIAAVVLDRFSAHLQVRRAMRIKTESKPESPDPKKVPVAK